MEVVDESLHRGDVAERGVRPLGVVVVDPAWQVSEPLGVAAIEASIGPLAEQRLDEALGLAVGLGPVRTRPPVAGFEGRERAAVGRARVAAGVVGQDPLDADPVAGEPDGCVEEGRRRTAALSSGTSAT